MTLLDLLSQPEPAEERQTRVARGRGSATASPPTGSTASANTLRDSDSAYTKNREAVRQFFQQRGPGVWIELWEFAETGVALNSVTSRIRDLRKPQYGGWTIKNRTRRVDGVCHSAYRWIA